VTSQGKMVILHSVPAGFTIARVRLALDFPVHCRDRPPRRPSIWFLFVISEFCFRLLSHPASRRRSYLPLTIPANRPVEDLHLQHQPILVHRKSQGAQNAPWLANTKTAVDLIICCSRPAVRGWDAESTSSRAKTEARRHTGCSPTGRQSRESKRTCPEPDRRHRWRRAACRRA
jgi:hypothetical protein